ncbi:hypothetical protein ACI1US_00034 [Leucobacter sp. BZR 635]
MQGSTRALIASGMGLALVLAGTAPLQPPTPASEVAGDAASFERSPLPSGSTIKVTATGDSGAGTFGAAIDLANATPGPDTIEFEAGLETTLTGAWTVDEGITIKGTGATVRWQPANPDTESWLTAEGAPVQISDLTLALETESWEPLIQVNDAPSEFTTVLENVTFRDPFSGGLRVEGSESAVEVVGITASGIVDDDDDADEIAVIELWEANGGFSLTDSRFVDLSTVAVALSGAQISAPGQVLVRGNTFSNIDVAEAEFTGMALHLDDISPLDETTRAEPMVLVTENTFENVRGWGEAVVSVSDVEGGVGFHDNTLTGNNSLSSTASFESLEGAFGAESPALVITDVALAGNTAEYSVLRVEGITAGVAIEEVTVTDSKVGDAGLTAYGISNDGEAANAAVTLRDVTIDGVRGLTEDEPPSAGLEFVEIFIDIDMERVAVSDVVANEGAAMISETAGGVRVSASRFVDSTGHGLTMEYVELPNNGQVHVNDSEFSRNSLMSGGSGAGLMIEAESEEGRDSPLVEIHTSSFADNLGGDSAGLGILTTGSGANAAGPNILVDSSTFSNPMAVPVKRSVGASDVYLEDATGVNGSEPAITVRNSTVERRDAFAPEVPGIIAVASGNGALIEHVSMPGAGTALTCGDGRAATVRNSALGADGLPAVQLTDDCEFSGEANTLTMLGDAPAGAGEELPVADWQLGELADNGGATQTLLPESTSPLLDSGVTSTVVVDQRGIARPQAGGPDRGAVEVEELVPALSTLEIGPDVTVEAGSPATLTVTRSGPAEEAATVAVELRDGTAVAGVDYAAKRYELSWAAGDTAAQKIAVTTLEHKPGSRALTAQLASPTGAELGARQAATVTITQEDPAITPPKPPGPPTVIDPPTAVKPPLSETGSGGWLPLAGLAAALLAAGAFALVARARSRRAREI